MTDAWEERKKALENQYFHDLDRELIEKIKDEPMVIVCQLIVSIPEDPFERRPLPHLCFCGGRNECNNAGTSGTAAAFVGRRK